MPLLPAVIDWPLPRSMVAVLLLRLRGGALGGEDVSSLGYCRARGHGPGIDLLDHDIALLGGRRAIAADLDDEGAGRAVGGGHDRAHSTMVRVCVTTPALFNVRVLPRSPLTRELKSVTSQLGSVEVNENWAWLMAVPTVMVGSPANGDGKGLADGRGGIADHHVIVVVVARDDQGRGALGPDDARAAHEPCCRRPAPPSR